MYGSVIDGAAKFSTNLMLAAPNKFPVSSRIILEFSMSFPVAPSYRVMALLVEEPGPKTSPETRVANSRAVFPAFLLRTWRPMPVGKFANSNN